MLRTWDIRLRRPNIARERIAHLVTETGELLRVDQDREPQRSYGRRFVLLFEDALVRLTDQITNGTTLRVLMRLPKHLDWETWRRLNQRQLAAELRMGTGSISRALEELHTLEVIERRGAGPVTEWRLSLELG